MTEPTKKKKKGTLSNTCPSCGTPVKFGVGAVITHCESCAREVLLSDLHEVPPPPSTYLTRPSVSSTPQTRRAILLLWLAPLVIAVGAGIAAYVHERGAKVERDEKKGAVGGELRWVATPGAPITTALDEDAIEDVIGVVTIGGKEAIGAFDGATSKLLWSVPVPGKSWELRFGVALAPRAIVAIDEAATAHILDPKDGHELRTAKIAERARRICAGSPLWIELANGAGITLDAATGEAKKGAPPPGCARYACGDLATHAECREARIFGLPTANGFTTARGFFEGTHGVALGTRGSVPTAVGFDPATFAVRWSVPLPASEDDASTATALPFGDLVDGRAFAAYAVAGKDKSTLHVTALAASTGDRAWDVDERLGAKETLGGMVASSARVYLARGGELEILDAQTGEIVGAIGAP